MKTRAAVAFAKKYRLKAVLGGATECWKEAKLLAESNIPVIINPAGQITKANEAMVRDLSEIRISDPVVHEGHGIYPSRLLAAVPQPRVERALRNPQPRGDAPACVYRSRADLGLLA